MIPLLRISSGLALFVFVACHLTNLGFGLISVQAMIDNTWWLMALFFNPVGGLLLVASLAVHACLGLESIYRRNTFRMSRMDSVQFISSLAIVPLLAPHVVGTMFAEKFYGIHPNYQVLLKYFWVDVPAEGLRQVLLLAIVWVNGCIGLFTWLRLRSWWPRVAPFIYPLAVALPVAAMLGFTEAGKVAIDGTLPPAGNYYDPNGLPFAERLAALNLIKWWAIGIFCALVAATLIARHLRLRTYSANTLVDYGEGRQISVPTGATLLEMAISGNVPHANLCRGRGRCGSCQVRILENEFPLAPPELREVETLVRAGAPQDARLACCTKPGGGRVRVDRLVPPDIIPAEFFRSAARQADAMSSQEAENAA